MHLFSLMGTVLTKVIMRTPAPSWMVMAEEEGLRRNRLGLLALIEALFLNVADISRLQG